MALVYPTEQMRRLKLVSLAYGKKECYILFRGIPESSIVRQLERVKRQNHQTLNPFIKINFKETEV